MSAEGFVTVVIVNWNSGDQLCSCVKSIILNGGQCVREIIVVDNASTDASDTCIEGVSGVRLIRAGANLGFGKACNLGARQALSEYLLFLNPDAALYADTLPKAMAWMQDPINARVGICGVQLLDEGGHVSRSCARFPSALGFAAHAFGAVRFFPRLGHFMTEWNHLSNNQVDHVIGACFLMRRRLFVSLNGFDERFFVYFEDVDLSFRSNQAGWSSMYLAEIQAFHAGGGTSRQVKSHRLFYSLRSRIQYSFKHFSILASLSVLLVTIIVEPFSRVALSMARGSWGEIKEVGSAYSMLCRWLTTDAFRELLKKR
jgi:GT2 family glycosyltransferase